MTRSMWNIQGSLLLAVRGAHPRARITMMPQWEESVRTMHARNAEIIAISGAVEAGKDVVNEVTTD